MSIELLVSIIGVVFTIFGALAMVIVAIKPAKKLYEKRKLKNKIRKEGPLDIFILNATPESLYKDSWNCEVRLQNLENKHISVKYNVFSSRDKEKVRAKIIESKGSRFSLKEDGGREETFTINAKKYKDLIFPLSFNYKYDYFIEIFINDGKGNLNFCKKMQLNSKEQKKNAQGIVNDIYDEFIKQF